MLTPSEYSKRNMIGLGVSKPIYTFPHGIDFNIFKPIKRIKNKPFTFVYIGELTTRKGTQDLIRAFIKNYGKNPDYKLILRANTHMYHYCGEEIRRMCSEFDNIECTWKDAGQEDIINYINSGNVYIHPSRADWFGMPPIESLATGCPTIATATNGYYDFLKDDGILIPLNYRINPIGSDHPYLLGDWSVVDVDSISRAMIYTENSYEYLAEKSFVYASKMKNIWSWEAVTREYLLPVLEEVDNKHFKNEPRRVTWNRNTTDVLSNIPSLIKA
jgi:glycosyltransferase involved in cell wall biosynthesis